MRRFMTNFFYKSISHFKIERVSYKTIPNQFKLRLK